MCRTELKTGKFFHIIFGCCQLVNPFTEGLLLQQHGLHYKAAFGKSQWIFKLPLCCFAVKSPPYYSASPTLNCSSDVRHGSVLRPILFSTYVSSVYHIAQSFTISHQQYADDILLYIALPASQPHSGIQHLE
jgi:hypothetical protein